MLVRVLEHRFSQDISSHRSLFLITGKTTEALLFWSTAFVMRKDCYATTSSIVLMMMVVNCCLPLLVLSRPNTKVKDLYSLTNQQFKKASLLSQKLKWRDSIAKKKLVNDIEEGIVPLNSNEGRMTLRDIYLMHPEYAEYDFDKFSSRLSSIRKTIKGLIKRADEDQEAFETFSKNHEISLCCKKGVALIFIVYVHPTGFLTDSIPH